MGLGASRRVQSPFSSKTSHSAPPPLNIVCAFWAYFYRLGGGLGYKSGLKKPPKATHPDFIAACQWPAPSRLLWLRAGRGGGCHCPCRLRREAPPFSLPRQGSVSPLRLDATPRLCCRDPLAGGGSAMERGVFLPDCSARLSGPSWRKLAELQRVALAAPLTACFTQREE